MKNVENTNKITTSFVWIARMPYILFHYIICILIINIIVPSMADCPVLCECKWRSGKESVICIKTNLTKIPSNLDSGTQVLDFTENNIISLKNAEFSDVGLVNLQKIFLSKCKLKTIERYSFKNLINLVELDLSYNVLSSIPSNAFESIREIRELKLNGNRIHKILNNTFINTPKLERLELSNCEISIIERNAFIGLQDTLKWLKLDRNKLIEIDALTFIMFHNLHGLELSDNLWNCSCKLRSLREWMINQNVPYDIPPICHSPKRLAEKSWKILDLDEFACSPTIDANEQRVRGIEGDNVTLVCNYDGVPKPNVKWLVRNKLMIANFSTISHVSRKKMYILNVKNHSSELTIYSIEMQDAGTYMCNAENKAGKAEAIVTLTIDKKTAETKMSQKVLLTSILLGVVLTFSCCVSAVFFFTFRKRKLLNWRTRECRRDDNYEKIEMKQKECSRRNINGGVGGGGGGGGGASCSDGDGSGGSVGGFIRENNTLVTISRRNGDYSVVPVIDTDHENDDDEDISTMEMSTSATSNERRWNSNQLDARGSGVDSNVEQNSRDNISIARNLMFGTYNAAAGACTPTTTTTTTTIQALPTNRNNNLPTTASTTISNNNGGRQVPDVIGHSPLPLKNERSRAQSENSSTNDINELFCTLPRKRDGNGKMYKSYDSQSPLLPESRYGSESGSSSESFARRLSIESQRYCVTNLNRKRLNIGKNTSGSLLNLSRDEKTIDPTSTPLLDVRGLESRISQTQKPFNKPAKGDLSINTNPYNYHAAQLERFLEEYRILQKQLTKMKETCDSICQEQMRDNNSSACTTASTNSSSSQSANLNNQINSPNSNQSIQNSVEFKNFENELTKYLMSRSSSTKNFNSNVLHN